MADPSDRPQPVDEREDMSPLPDDLLFSPDPDEWVIRESQQLDALLFLLEQLRLAQW